MQQLMPHILAMTRQLPPRPRYFWGCFSHLGQLPQDLTFGNFIKFVVCGLSLFEGCKGLLGVSLKRASQISNLTHGYLLTVWLRKFTSDGLLIHFPFTLSFQPESCEGKRAEAVDKNSLQHILHPLQAKQPEIPRSVSYLNVFVICRCYFAVLFPLLLRSQKSGVHIDTSTSTYMYSISTYTYLQKTDKLFDSIVGARDLAEARSCSPSEDTGLHEQVGDHRSFNHALFNS